MMIRVVSGETGGCVGCCGLAPVAAVNNAVVGELASRKIGKLIKSLKEQQWNGLTTQKD